jgi:hypothetical protein
MRIPLTQPGGRHARSEEAHYFKKLAALHAQGKIPRVGLSEIDVLHDEWCGIYTGGYCNCHPEIQVRPWERRPGEPSAN